MSRKLLSDVVEFFREHEKKLRPDERLPMSTEIIESSFSRYKQFEKQHSKNGFTSLLLTYPVLLRKTTPEEVKESFARTRIRDVQAWVNTNMPSTLTSKRQLFYREAKKSDMKTEKRATTEITAA